MDHHEHDAPDVAERAPMAGHEHQPAGDHDVHAAGYDRHAGHSVAMFRDIVVAANAQLLRRLRLRCSSLPALPALAPA